MTLREKTLAVIVCSMLTVGCVGYLCKKPEISSGWVTGKQHVPSKTTTTLMPMGKSLMPMTTHHPEKFLLEYQADGRSAVVHIREYDYHRIEVGDWFSTDGTSQP